MAEAVLKHLTQANEKIQWTIDSAALANWNVGRSPEPRCLAVLKENEISTNHIGRQVNHSNFS